MSETEKIKVLENALEHQTKILNKLGYELQELINQHDIDNELENKLIEMTKKIIGHTEEKLHE